MKQWQTFNYKLVITICAYALSNFALGMQISQISKKKQSTGDKIIIGLRKLYPDQQITIPQPGIKNWLTTWNEELTKEQKNIMKIKDLQKKSAAMLARAKIGLLMSYSAGYSAVGCDYYNESCKSYANHYNSLKKIEILRQPYKKYDNDELSLNKRLKKITKTMRRIDKILVKIANS